VINKNTPNSVPIGMSGNKQGHISFPVGLGDQYGKYVLYLNQCVNGM
jgi:hypothetical protein